MNVKLISITRNDEKLQERIMDLIQEFSNNLDNHNEEKLLRITKKELNNIFNNNNIVNYITNFARTCTNRDNKETNDKKDFDLCVKLWKDGHYTPFESIHIDFLVEDVSRVLLAQITRYRMASFNVESQRYCNYKDKELNFIIPEKLENAPSINLSDFFMNLSKSKEIYNDFIDKGAKPEDARFVLPSATPTRFRMSCNLKEFLHIFKQRSTKHAQTEIRDLVEYMMMCLFGSLSKESQDLILFIRDMNEHRLKDLYNDILNFKGNLHEIDGILDKYKPFI